MHLFLSPHPDDAPLSCGGTIYHLREAQNAACVILTLMSGDPPATLPDSPLVQELHQRWQAGDNPAAIRRHEDEQAAAVLSAKSIIHTAVPDCIYRTNAAGDALYSTGEAIFGDVHPQDELPAALAVTPLPNADRVTHLYAPLGVGNHVDHQIVRDWMLQLAAKHPHIALFFYEDYPYCEDAAAVTRALAFYQERGIQLEAQPFALREMDVMIKLVALQNYTSQISSFWASIAEMDEAIQGYMQRAGEQAGTNAPVERYWRLKTTT